VAAELEREGVVLRERQRERLPDDDPAAAAVEVEPDVHPVPAVAGLGGEPHVRPLRGERVPPAHVLEVVEDDRRPGARPAGPPGHARPRRGGEPAARRRHSFTPPAVIPATYQRCRRTNTTTIGRTVSTAPAIMSSVSCTCSPASVASATGSV